ncbi:CPBP family intramembrane glutamic endopeptidase [Geodermatophilus sabuli]|uniref:Membrane protease YdiL, CAAX protease family n=1 Tax=Geodermatophilus sabuli TaxID=1564158 RepID=A0A285EDY3_9ACTN|nr:CPBP family intramembrane glutamic endopeptidase [Geodermatophilus sabuli]MBB3084477.1 membrane protease YdiL (CAAX protease family) [Geodermatophilus sabuli]SNX97328.1 Membrane protease YdiL, CAAX protease family [Geodermatophilus sabuli]
MTTSAARRRHHRLVSGGVVVALAAVNVVDHGLHPPWWVRGLEGVALLAWARWEGLTWSQLGLGRDRLRAGCRWGLGAIAVAAGVYVIGLLLPVTRPAFQDVRYDLPVPGALHKAFVVIPLGTVALEELAFRSVLWGVLARHLRQWQVLVTTSVLFGLWHIIPSVDLGETNRGVSDAVGGAGSAVVVAGTVAFTAIGGLVFGELRRRSGSVLASAAAHWATNALGVLFGVVAWRLDRQG